MNRPLTIPEIRKLKPTFYYNEVEMVEWFEVNHGSGWATIRSGLQHADGVTRSPFFIQIMTGGNKASLQARIKFTEWWENIQKVNQH